MTDLLADKTTLWVEAKKGAAKPDHIYMDAMAFGMGCCCLQITFQAWNVNEARRVYDALVPVTPIMLALTAASPAFRGYLADVDARWDVIAASVDDRTEEERGLKVSVWLSTFMLVVCRELIGTDLTIVVAAGERQAPDPEVEV